MGNLGFRTNNIYKQEELQIKTHTPYRCGERVLPDAGYTAMTAVDVNDVPMRNVDNTNPLGNAYGNTILIGTKEIPVIKDGVIVNEDFIASVDEGATTETYSGVPYFGKSGSVTIYIKNGFDVNKQLRLCFKNIRYGSYNYTYNRVRYTIYTRSSSGATPSYYSPESQWTSKYTNGIYLTTYGPNVEQTSMAYPHQWYYGSFMFQIDNHYRIGSTVYTGFAGINSLSIFV